MNNILNYCRRFKQVSPPMDSPVFIDEPDVIDSFDPLLQTIYTKDPVTGMPSGDLAIFLSKDANPDVKTFIEQQLLQPVSSSDGSSMPTEVVNKFRTLSDDDIAKFSRNHGESREDYASRLNYYFAKERENRLRERDENERKQWLERARELDKARSFDS